MSGRSGAWRVLLLSLPLVLADCSGWQSSLDPKGPQAEHLALLFYLFTAVTAIVWLLVMAALAIGLWRASAAGRDPADPLARAPARDRRAGMIVAVAIAATVIVLIGLTAASYLATRSLAAAGSGEPVNIKLTGHQWWWELQYDDPRPARVLATANEIHVPVARPIRIELTSGDVIHSFWVPSLMGKQDLIPGRDNAISFVVDRAGVYRGQCAEFCGWQHAHMAMLLIAESGDEFEAWRNAQLMPAETPGDPARQQGLQVFLGKPCILCHSIRGTSAGGKVAPDLTHVASRRYIAAGTLPTSRGSIAAWLADPQHIKPAAKMPRVELSANELDALAGYLADLR